MKEYFCLDCKKNISRNGIRCKSCATKYRIKIGSLKLGQKKYIDYNKVKNLYLNDNMNARDIGLKLNIHSGTVRNILKKGNIKLRKTKILYCLDCGKKIQKKSIRCRECKIKCFEYEITNKRDTIIECDGDYWHGNPILIKNIILTERQIKQKERDEIRTKELINKGYKVIRLWESDIRKLSLEDLNIILKSQKEVFN